MHLAKDIRQGRIELIVAQHPIRIEIRVENKGKGKCLTLILLYHSPDSWVLNEGLGLAMGLALGLAMGLGLGPGLGLGLAAVEQG